MQAEREITVLQRDSSIRCCLKGPFMALVKQIVRDFEEKKKAPLRARDDASRQNIQIIFRY